MLKCEHCIHKNVCIDGANYRNAEKCRNFINENDVAPVKHGECFEVTFEGESNKMLFDAFRQSYRYCPTCGAKIDGGENNGT